MVYCTFNPATALLETLVHMEIDEGDRPARFQVLKIDAPDETSRERVDVPGLANGWEHDLNVSQQLGSEWLVSRRNCLLEVPSVLVPETWNVLVNPVHPEAAGLKIIQVYQHAFDARFRT